MFNLFNCLKTSNTNDVSMYQVYIYMKIVVCSQHVNSDRPCRQLHAKCGIQEQTMHSFCKPSPIWRNKTCLPSANLPHLEEECQEALPTEKISPSVHVSKLYISNPQRTGPQVCYCFTTEILRLQCKTERRSFETAMQD